MPQQGGDHSRLVYSVIRGTSRQAEAPQHVKRSWLRCIDEYGLDPDSNAPPAVVSRQELIARKEQSLDLVSFADAEMARLHRQLDGSGHSIVLADRDAVVPFRHSRKLFERAGNPKDIWIVPRAGHIQSLRDDAVRQRLTEYLLRLSRGAPSRG